MKEGYKTTEFWMTLAANAVAILVLFGVFTPEESGQVQDGLSNAIEAVAALVVSLGTVWKYIESRTAVKTAK